MQGLRTILVGLVMAIAPVALQFLGGIDWTTALPANLVWAAPILSGLVMIGMRFITKTPVHVPGLTNK